MGRDDDASDLVARYATEDLPGAPASAQKTANSAALVTAGILLSRLFGLLRTQLLAHTFGVTPFSDVITQAFKIGNITQNLLGEGTLSASFIPIYAKLRAEGRSDHATHFARSSLGLLLLVVAAVSGTGVLLAPWLTQAIAPGFSGEKLEHTVRMLRVVFPMTGLLVLSAWALGVLNTHRQFFLPYAAPVLWNAAQIVGVLGVGSLLGAQGDTLAMTVAWSALIGALLQLAVLLPAARTRLGGLELRFDTAEPAVRDAARRLPGVLLGRGVIQLSGLIDTALVSLLGDGAAASFQFAQALYLLPMSILGTGEAAASLPEMASDTADLNPARRDAQIRARLGASLARVTALTVPATLALALLGDEIIRVLLQRGHFDQDATARVARILSAYAFALLGNAASRVLTTASYAIGDTRTPARYAVLRMLVCTVSSVALMQWFDVVGVVLGAVMAAWVETLALGWKLRQTLGGLGLDALPVGRLAALAVACVVPTLGLREALPQDFAQGFVGSTLILAVFGAALAVAASKLQLLDVRSLLQRKRR